MSIKADDTLIILSSMQVESAITTKIFEHLLLQRQEWLDKKYLQNNKTCQHDV